MQSFGASPKLKRAPKQGKLIVCVKLEEQIYRSRREGEGEVRVRNRGERRGEGLTVRLTTDGRRLHAHRLGHRCKTVSKLSRIQLRKRTKSSKISNNKNPKKRFK